MALLVIAAGGCDTGKDPDQAAAGSPRVAVIGWDGATWDVIDPLLEAGRLPNLAALLERGTRAELIARPPLLSLTSSPMSSSSSACGGRLCWRAAA